MERLLEYLQQHPILASLAVAYWRWPCSLSSCARGAPAYAALRPQQAIQLMNQGAQLYDLRDAAGLAAGHINGAKHLDPAPAGQRRRPAEALQGPPAAAVLRGWHPLEPR